MFFQITDAQGAKITFNSANVTALMIPSALAPGDGKSRLMMPNAVVELPREEAERIQTLLLDKC